MKYPFIIFILSLAFAQLPANPNDIKNKNLEIVYGHRSFDDRSNAYFGESDIASKENNLSFMNVIHEKRNSYHYVAQGKVENKDLNYLEKDAIWAAYRKVEGELIFIDHLFYKTNYSLAGQYGKYYMFTAPSLDAQAYLKQGDLLYPTGRVFDRREQNVFKLIDQQKDETSSFKHYNNFAAYYINPNEFGISATITRDYKFFYWGFDSAISASVDYFRFSMPFGIFFKISEKSIFTIGPSIGYILTTEIHSSQAMQFAYTFRFSDKRAIQLMYESRSFEGTGLISGSHPYDEPVPEVIILPAFYQLALVSYFL